MSIEDLRAPFSVVNPHDGANPDGNCAHCAVETARALTLGVAPTRVNGTIGNVVGNGVPVLRTFLSTVPHRAGVVLQYLRAAAPAGVYAVETPDHAYNFVILPGGQIYLIDSNQHIFRQIRTLADFEATGHNATLADGYDYNYGDPEEDDDTDMDFYHWGALAARWHVLLTQTRGQVWFNNGARQQVRTTALGSKTLD